MNALLEAACGYAAIGLRVLPVEPGGKIPILTDWPNRATTDEEMIRQWWASTPQANVGIATGRGVFVLDIDGETGRLMLRVLEAEHGELPETVTANTPGGGQHRWFKVPAGVAIPNKVRFADGLDIRSDGGQVVAPPSVHPSGRLYGFAPGLTFDDTEIAEAPAWLIELILKPQESGNGKLPETIPLHHRNDLMFRLACALRAKGASRDGILGCLRGENARCKPPLSEKELEQIAESACRYPEGKPPAAATAETKPANVGPQLAGAFLRFGELLVLPALPRVPILGEAGRLLSTGMYAILTGRDGSAKTFEALHLLAAVAACLRYFGIPTCGPYAVAYLLTDDDRDVVRERMKAILKHESIDRPDVHERIHVLARPWPWGSHFDLIANASPLIDYLIANQIRLLVVDHAAAVHSCSPLDLRPLIDAADRIANEAEAALLFLTHPSKAGKEDKDGDSWGDSRFANMARLRMFTRKIGRGYRLAFSKPSRGPTPEPLELAHASADDPSLVLTEGIDPATAKASRLDKTRALLAKQPDTSAAQLGLALGVTKRTAERYLEELRP